MKDAKKIDKVVKELKDEGVKAEVVKEKPPVKEEKSELAKDEKYVERMGMTFIVNKTLGTMKRVI